ncbi:cytochrome C assembly family protein [Arenimonas sp.]|uniref:cytochrome C assembly family protein n=1 Tax=Arenimonas sp. TaxID=1872635 RepID=UPI002E2F0EFB|nr:cytochrome c biogenesis protein CcsA [Arenimonas sp.]HEX4853900.1 cytochrome c biogenesis protein CcsA [Arenimonas sp.]
MTALALALLASVLYLLASHQLAGHAQQPHPTPRRWLLLAVPAVLLHAGVHVLAWRLLGGADLHFFAALSLVGLGMAALTTGLGPAQRIEALGIIVFPLATATLLAYAGLGGGMPQRELGWPLQLHALLALLAYATLAVATLLALMLWFQDRALRQRHLGGWLRVLPPLTQMETLLFRCLGVGFALLSLTLLTGVLFVENLFAQDLGHKTVLSILSWAVLGVLLFGRWRWGWRGPRAVKLTLLAMGLLLLAFFGSKFVYELVLHRG